MGGLIKPGMRLLHEGKEYRTVQKVIITRVLHMHHMCVCVCVFMCVILDVYRISVVCVYGCNFERTFFLFVEYYLQRRW